MSLVGGAAVLVVSLILLRTIVAQRRSRGWRDLMLNNMGLLPQWKFFGPEPLIYDMYMLARDRFGDGALGPWQPVIGPARRSLFGCLDKRFADMADHYCDIIRNPETNVLHPEPSRSLGYIALLRHCQSRLTRPAGAQSRQFAIVHRQARRYSVVFVSNLHPWERQ